ncbi:MAG: CapA family protein [Elusimicrobiota bacterium]
MGPLVAACDRRGGLSRRPPRLLGALLGAAAVVAALRPAPAALHAGSGEPGAAPLEARVSTEPFVTLSAVGDIRLDGPVARIAAAHGPGAPVKDVLAWLDSDIVFGNLECAVTERGEAAAKEYTFRAPPDNLRILSAAGFTLLSVANNHVMDFGPQGMRDTLAALSRGGLLYAGAGPTARAARRPVFIEKNGLRIGLLALTSTLPEGNWAGPDSPGVAYSDFARVPEWVRAAKRDCDILIVSFHGGTQLAPEPNEVQRAFVRLAADAGADVILGHHPHVVQPVEVRGGALILYSLGNFLFVSPTPGTERSFIARLRLSREGVRAEFVPVDVNYGRIREGGPEVRAAVREALDRTGALTRDPEKLRLSPSAPN